MEHLYFSEYQTNRKNRVFVAPGAERSSFDACLDEIRASGFQLKAVEALPSRCFAACEKERAGVFVTWFEGTRELRVAAENDCPYFEYGDVSRDRTVSPQITQIALEDSGMSYVIRLSDGRFVLLDGGWNFAPDVEKLYRCLTESSAEGETPEIAAWILTHPHRDHYQCFVGFMQKYGDRVILEKVLLNFPEADDPRYQKDFTYEDPRVPGSSEIENLPKMWSLIESSGASVYTPHTGQRYRIGDGEFEILSCFDDTVDLTESMNASSLVMRMRLAGQTVLWTGDAGFSYCRLTERYGGDVKADILQVPHHGFRSGTSEAEIAGYDQIAPSVCLLPVSEFYGYTSFGYHRDNLRHLMLNCPIDEMIAGSVTRTLELPYTPPVYGRQEHLRRCEDASAACGAKHWVFTGLSTARPGDFVFEFLNMTYLKAAVDAELFFEEEKQLIRHIRIPLSRLRVQPVNIVGEDVDGEAVWFNEHSLGKKGIPENASFSVRFRCDIPIVVSHKDHKDTYHG